MSEKEDNSQSGVGTPIHEGYKPESAIKGFQPIIGKNLPGDLNTRGFKPVASNLDSSNPPQGGSGVPTTQAGSQTTKP